MLWNIFTIKITFFELAEEVEKHCIARDYGLLFTVYYGLLFCIG